MFSTSHRLKTILKKRSNPLCEAQVYPLIKGCNQPLEKLVSILVSGKFARCIKLISKKCFKMISTLSYPTLTSLNYRSN